ncbi:AAA family ATPase [Leptolyngbya sp. GGD]|uniref:AAA family ATPase n=1 Tax=Leptolyngbya sp. GGD TaxID=2997907 RepID=UPI00227B109E|nr:ATP-binding protein [Leptolyngbya sp. GGD]MCY6491644.1 ATP-binding protein [Leptolyngbya sp. GGD]
MSPEINPFLQSSTSLEQATVTPQKNSRFFSPLVVEGGSLGIYGERGVGKSLMLNYIANPPRDWKEAYLQNHISIFFNCQDTIIPLSISNFWLQTIKQLDRKLEPSPIKDKCRALLTRIDEGNELNHNDFHEVLDVAAGAAKRIVLVLDDFDCLIRTSPEHFDNTRTFLQGFRSLTTRDSNRANLVVATRYSLQELCKPLTTPNYSAFENGFTNYRLRSFSESELLKFLQRVEQTNQPPFTPAETRYIAYLSGYHPRLIQIAAAELFDQRFDIQLPLSDPSSIGERFKSEARPILEGLWQGTSEIEKLLLMLITLQKLEGKVTGARYELRDLPDFLETKDREINELTERGLLIRTQDNPPTWDLFSPIFQWWILKEIESSDPEQLNDRRKVWGELVTQKRADQMGELVKWVKQNPESLKQLWDFVMQMATTGGFPKLPGT